MLAPTVQHGSATCLCIDQATGHRCRCLPHAQQEAVWELRCDADCSRAAHHEPSGKPSGWWWSMTSVGTPGSTGPGRLPWSASTKCVGCCLKMRCCREGTKTFSPLPRCTSTICPAAPCASGSRGGGGRILGRGRVASGSACMATGLCVYQLPACMRIPVTYWTPK